MASQNSPKVRVTITQEDLSYLRILRAARNSQKVFLMLPDIASISDIRGAVIIFPTDLFNKMLPARSGE